MSEQKELQDLGYANGWKGTPEIVQKCAAKGHRCESVSIGKCITLYKCTECGYKYKVDSGD